MSFSLVINLCGCHQGSKHQNRTVVPKENKLEVCQNTELVQNAAERLAANLQIGLEELEELFDNNLDAVSDKAAELLTLYGDSQEKLLQFNEDNRKKVDSLQSEKLSGRQKAYEEKLNKKTKKAKVLLMKLADDTNRKLKKKSLEKLKTLFDKEEIHVYGSEPENIAKDAEVQTKEIVDLDTYEEKLQKKSITENGKSDFDELLEVSAETVLTKGMKKKAEELSTPLNVYNYLKNSIDYELYSGSRKGAEETFETLAGNDKDQASLMIAMLRYLGYPARYVDGTILLNEEQVTNLTGADDIQTGAQVLSSAGMPVTILTTGGEVTAVSLEHTWVEAYLPYTEYRGAGKNSGDSLWVSLDTGIWKYEKVDNISDFLEERNITANWEALVENKDVDAVLEQQEMLKEQLLKEDVDNLYLKRRMKAENTVSYLPLSLQYTVLTKKDSYATIKEVDADAVEFRIAGKTIGKYKASELSGKRITIEYETETQEDKTALEAYGSIFEVPAYLVHMIPVLKFDGEEIARGNAAILGTSQNFTMKIWSSGTQTEICNAITAGSLYQVTFDGQIISGKELEDSYEEYKSIAETATLENVYSDEYLGRMLDVAGKLYFAQIDIANIIAGEGYGVKATRSLSEGMTGYQVQTSSLYGTPVGVSEGSFFIDVDHDCHGAVSLSGNKEDEKSFMRASGIISSLYESVIWEEMTGTESVSTISILRAAGEQGISLLVINKDNYEELSKQLDVDSATFQAVKDAVEQGKEVTIPANEVTIGNWCGSGYIVMDTSSGAAEYMISGGWNGGTCSFLVHLQTMLGVLLSCLSIMELVGGVATLLSATLTIWGWALLVLEIVLLILEIQYLIEIFITYDSYMNGNEEAGDTIIRETTIVGALTLIGFCVARIMKMFNIKVDDGIHQQDDSGSGGMGSAGDDTPNSGNGGDDSPNSGNGGDDSPNSGNGGDDSPNSGSGGDDSLNSGNGGSIGDDSPNSGSAGDDSPNSGSGSSEGSNGTENGSGKEVGNTEGGNNSWVRNLDNTNDLNIDDFLSLKDNGVVKVNTSGSNRPLTGAPNSYYKTGNGEHIFVYDGDGKLIYDISSSRVKGFKINVDPNGVEHYQAYKLEGAVPDAIKKLFGW